MHTAAFWRVLSRFEDVGSLNLWTPGVKLTTNRPFQTVAVSDNRNIFWTPAPVQPGDDDRLCKWLSLKLWNWLYHGAKETLDPSELMMLEALTGLVPRFIAHFILYLDALGAAQPDASWASALSTWRSTLLINHFNNNNDAVVELSQEGGNWTRPLSIGSTLPFRRWVGADPRGMLAPDQVVWIKRAGEPRLSPADVPAVANLARELVHHELKPQADSSWQWSVDIGGAPITIRSPHGAPDANPWNDATILVWPPAEMPKWNVNYVASYATSSDGKVLPAFHVVYLDNTNLSRVSGICNIGKLYRIEGRIQYLELGSKHPDPEAADGFIYKPGGLIKVHPRPGMGSRAAQAATELPSTKVTPDVVGEVFLDFGTSNSAVAYRLAGKKLEYVRSGTTQIAKSARRVAYEPTSYETLIKAVAVLFPWYEVPTTPTPSDKRERDEIRKYVPSLLLRPDVAPADTQVQAAACIPPRHLEVDLLAVAGRRIPRDLKWSGTPEDIASFLELALLPALWELKQGSATKWKLTATYPLAMPAERRIAFNAILGQVSVDGQPTPLGAYLSSVTGLTLAPAALMSESEAGIQHFDNPGNYHLAVTLDMGGGTLDLGLFAGNAGQQTPDASGAESDAKAQAEFTVLAADSMKYGARFFLRALCESYRETFDAAPELRERDQGERVEILEKILHHGGLNGVLQIIAPAKGGSHQDAVMRWCALLAGMMMYVKAMINGAVDNHLKALGESGVTVNVCLLGQGWELFSGVPHGDHTPLRNWGVDVILGGLRGDGTPGTNRLPLTVEVANQLPLEDRKMAVVNGAAKMPGASNRTAVVRFGVRKTGGEVRPTFVGMNLYNSKDGQTIKVLSATKRLEDLDANDFRSLAVGTIVDRGFGEALETLAKEMNTLGQPNDVLPETAKKDLQRCGETGLNKLLQGGIPLTKSPLADFLEECWLPYWVPPDDSDRR